MAHLALRFCGEEALLRTGAAKAGRPAAGHDRAALPDLAWPILGCLLASPHHRATRGGLMAQLWPDQDEDGARHRFATALWRIRSALAEAAPMIVAEGEVIALNLDAHAWVDAVAVERRLTAVLAAPQRLALPGERRRLVHALGQYRGPFLPERDQEWIMLQRARLQSLHLDALYALTAAAAQAGAWSEAQVSASRLCAAEPLREDAQRLLMEAHLRCGNRALALRQYRRCEAILAQELGVAPMPETRALAATIAGEDHGAAIPVLLPAVPDDATSRAALIDARDKVLETLRIIDRALTC
ncbi:MULTISPECIES: BTAD domain-containing putative transcriptional regulator [unclassified Paracoccus (in: a-proteobacteria)]|uniref:AfsR/SARP family transcriptional regulator n=1 Tax=unclassified Paracoccus (in: a-proteobacteria) TaxID=2688777 RepID=UPI00160042BF|nr:MULTISPECIES: BTAD domain-containing putative transcriptional regulator [unclassified Paracoccus (in: a-proteobacteria)]MBB1492724.1 hypothetical protein [Paracoccus sp. MC1854]MBB1499343.1 hypothetical protein [Paracoccus sp. MC1862]QQO45100.1 hypothetical protein JGR78_01465 [Paracoccus sp. MC1862]